MSDSGLVTLAGSGGPGRPAGPVRLLYVGRLVRTKGARDAIRAIGLLPGLSVRLDVVGDGFDRGACEALAGSWGSAERVSFHGWLPRPRVEEFYRSADVFVFPSYREPGGNVIFEAMGHGLPLVVSDRGGPGAAVDETCGIRVHPASPDQYAQDLASAWPGWCASRRFAWRLARERGAGSGDRPLGGQGAQAGSSRVYGGRPWSARPIAGRAYQGVQWHPYGAESAARAIPDVARPDVTRRAGTEITAGPSSRRAGRTWC